MVLVRDYIGVDPGTTTVLAVMRMTENGWIAVHEQIENPHDVAYWLRKHCEGRFIEMIYESFYFGERTLKAGTKGVRDALNLIGWIEIFMGDEIGVRVYSQSPAEGKTIKDGQLKAMGLYNPAMRHGTDAMRHIVRHHLNHHRKSNVTQEFLKINKK